MKVEELGRLPQGRRRSKCVKGACAREFGDRLDDFIFIHAHFLAIQVVHKVNGGFFFNFGFD